MYVQMWELNTCCGISKQMICWGISFHLQSLIMSTEGPYAEILAHQHLSGESCVWIKWSLFECF